MSSEVIIVHIVCILLGIVLHLRRNYFLFIYKSILAENDILKIYEIPTFKETVMNYMMGLIFLLSIGVLFTSLIAAYGIGIMIMMILRHIPELQEELQKNER